MNRDQSAVLDPIIYYHAVNIADTLITASSVVGNTAPALHGTGR
jgi:hypothetical protein